MDISFKEPKNQLLFSADIYEGILFGKDTVYLQVGAYGSEIPSIPKGLDFQDSSGFMPASDLETWLESKKAEGESQRKEVIVDASFRYFSQLAYMELVAESQ